MPIPVAAVLHLLFPAQLIAAAPRTPLPQPAPTATRVAVHQNRNAAGRLDGRTLTVALDVVEGRWHAEGATDPEVPILAFGEPGKTPVVPGPLLRAPLGTTVELTLRNRTDSALVLGGLRPGSGMATDTVHLAAGATRALRYTLRATGTFMYWGAFKGTTWEERFWKDSQLNGAIVVDAPGASTRDEILLLSEWFLEYEDDRAFEVVSVINGKAWPHTDVLQATQGDSVHVRVVNAIPLSHPLHLHGFYYRITSHGDGTTDTRVPRAKQRLSNTDIVRPGQTMSFSFLASTPGNWLFHCHLAFHVDETVSLAGSPRDSAAMRTASTASHAAHAASPTEHMRGLVVGLKVAAAPSHTEPSMAGARDMHLFVQRSPRRLITGADAIGFALQQDGKPPARDSVVLPGPVLELVRGKPVRIMVHNNLTEPTSVHWHGLEIESFPDGVPHWSGIGDKRYGQIDPGQSFVAAFVPPRSGTYPYHSHFNDRKQITSGMYGAIIVTDAPRDTTRDHLVVIGGGGPWVIAKNESPYALVNGRRAPSAIHMTAGETHRLRIVAIHPDWLVNVHLRDDSTTLRWRPLAKDGADLPIALRRDERATVTMGPGQTNDYTVRPLTPGRWTLDVATEDAGWSIRVPIIIDAPKKPKR